jgi:photosystem II stability/assembly factor-like uncharacterized protein
MTFRLAAVLLSLLAGALTTVGAGGPPAGPRFVAVGHHGLRLSSADGVKWEHVQTGKEGETYRAVCFGNGRFVAVGGYGGSNIFAVSADGKTWKTAQRDARYVTYLRGLGFGKGTFLGLGGDPGAVGDSRPFVMQTADGDTWTDLRPVAGKNILRRVAFGGGRFVAVGDRGRRAVSEDGLTWKDAPAAKAADTLIDVAFGNGIFVGVGLHGLRMTSADGLTWTDRQTGEEGEHLNAVVWADRQFVAVGMGATYTSPDGRAWQRHDNTNAPLSVTFGNGTFLGPSWKGRILRSVDGIRWQQVYQAEHHIEAIAFGDHK